MAVTTEIIGNQVYRLTIDGKDYLGIQVPAYPRSIAGQTQDSRKERGWLVVGSRAEPWEVGGRIEHEGKIYAYGPYHEVHSLSNMPIPDPKAAVARIASFVLALAALKQRDFTSTGLLPDALVVDPDAGFLFLPQAIIESIHEAQTEPERLESFDRFHHPDLKNERDLCFSIGVVLYRILTGSDPFVGDTSEELHERMRKQKVVPPRLHKPELRAEVSQTIVRALDPSESFDISDWQSSLDAWSREGLFEEISTKERGSVEREERRAKRSSDVRFNRRVFLRRNWRKLAIVGAVVILIGAVGGTMLKSAFKPRITVGMSPEQVVSLFYSSMTKLDNQAMQDCVIDGAGKSQINETTNLFVISRVQKGYGGMSANISAQQWLDQGKPKFTHAVFIFGVANLKITKEAQGVYTASYEKWQPAQTASSAQSSDSGPKPLWVQGFNMVDTVHLKNEGKFWAIDKIANVQNNPISPPVLVGEASAPSRPGAGNATPSAQ